MERWWAEEGQPDPWGHEQWQGGMRWGEGIEHKPTCLPHGPCHPIPSLPHPYLSRPTLLHPSPILPHLPHPCPILPISAL